MAGRTQKGLEFPQRDMHIWAPTVGSMLWLFMGRVLESLIAVNDQSVRVFSLCESFGKGLEDEWIVVGTPHSNMYNPKTKKERTEIEIPSLFNPLFPLKLFMLLVKERRDTALDALQPQHHPFVIVALAFVLERIFLEAEYLESDVLIQSAGRFVAGADGEVDLFHSAQRLDPLDQVEHQLPRNALASRLRRDIHRDNGAFMPRFGLLFAHEGHDADERPLVVKRPEREPVLSILQPLRHALHRIGARNRFLIRGGKRLRVLLQRSQAQVPIDRCIFRR